MRDNPPLHWTAAAGCLPCFEWSSARPRPVNGKYVMRQKKSPSEIVVASGKPVPYRLAFRTSEKGVPAMLTAPLLDRALHERGAVLTYFRSVSGASQGGKIALDAFEAA